MILHQCQNARLDHPVISGSSYAQIRLCPGYAWLQRLVPRVENDWTRGGTLIHKACQNKIEGKEVPPDWADYANDYVGALQRIGETWDAEVRYGSDMAGGTVDSVEPNKRIIVDLKTGHSKKVRPDDWQLKFYAAVSPFQDGGSLGVYQPAFYGKSVALFEFTREDVAGWADDVAETKHRVIHNPALVPGAHCDSCKARAYCREQKPKKQPKPIKPAAAQPKEIQW